jgi:hypothetical protein
MSETQEDFATGQRGVEESLGYSPMPMAQPIDKQDDDALDGRQAAEEILNRRASGQAERDQQELEREARPVDIVRQYNDNATRERRPANETVSAEQAAFDLAQSRRSEAETVKAFEDAAVADAIDQLRAQPVEAQPQQQEVPQQEVPQQEVPQPEVNQAGDDEVVRLLQSNPRLLNAINQEVGQHAAQAEHARQSYAQAVTQNATAALAACLSYFPEIQQCNTNEQLTAALHAISKTNPQRYNEIAQHLGRVRNLVGEAQRVAAVQQQAQAQQQEAQWAAYQQQYAQAWTQGAKAADDQYAKFSQQYSAEQNAEITKEAMSMLRDYGMTDADIAYQWNNNPSFRSFPAQRMMHDAARWRMLGRGSESKRVKTAPQVQRPGSPAERVPDSDYRLDKLRAKLDASGSARDAAAYLTARRAAGR